MFLSDNTFMLYAAKYYENPQCSSVDEFEEDLKRIQYLRKLFGKYEQTGAIKERLVLNHMIVLFNCFGPNTTNMLFMKLPEYHSYIKPFIEYLSFMPNTVTYENKTIKKSDIQSDHMITKILEAI